MIIKADQEVEEKGGWVPKVGEVFYYKHDPDTIMLRIKSDDGKRAVGSGLLERTGIYYVILIRGSGRMFGNGSILESAGRQVMLPYHGTMKCIFKE